jgi:phosphoenolpyruvate synthase/pyruvate phosphate dikinase
MDLDLKVFLLSNKYEKFFNKSIEEQLSILNKEFNSNLDLDSYEIYFYEKMKLISDEDFELESRKQINNYQNQLEFYEEKETITNRCGQMSF